MITRNTKSDIISVYPLHSPYKREEVLFFDIETTGFSANTSLLYMIGCMYYKDGAWHITQWLANDRLSETLVLEAFIHMVKSYKRLIHYNGSGFDLPFITKKCKQYGLENPFLTIESFDLYKKIKSYKKLFPLPNYKLKSLETFIGIRRKDCYMGEELIQVYANYLGKLNYEKLHQINDNNPNHIPAYSTIQSFSPDLDNKLSPSSKELMDILLLHNFEDVQNLPNIGELLYYIDIFEKEDFLSDKGNLRLMDGDSIVNEDIVPQSYCCISYTLPFVFLRPVSLCTPLPEPSPLHTPDTSSLSKDFSLKLQLINNQLNLFIPKYQGELKYFYENFKDYYYLPKEDKAIHISVAQYVDKEFRKKAIPSTCYNKKSALFLPQTDIIISPFFKGNYTDKITYLEYNNTKQMEPLKLVAYLKALLQYISTSKETKSSV